VKNNKILGITAWALGLALSLLLLFLIPKDLNGTVWAIIVCTVLVYLLHLALWLALQKGNVDFHNMPALTLSVFSLIAQTTWAVIVAFAATAIPTKIAILINALLIIVQVFAIVLALISKNHIENVSKRQKDHHVEL